MTPPPAAPAAGPAGRDWALILLLGFLWGASFLGAKLALADFGPVTIAAARVTLAAIILCAALRPLGLTLPGLAGGVGRRFWLFAAAMGVFSNAAPFTMLNWAQQSVASAFAGVVMATVPLFVLPLAHVLVPGERLGPLRTLGFAAGFAGVVVLIGPAELVRLGPGDIWLTLARLACVAAALCYAVGSIVTRRAPGWPLLVLGAGALLVAAAVLIPIALVMEGLPAARPGAAALGGLIYLGLGPTALATLILVRVIRSAGPGFLSLTNYMVPLWSVALGAAVLGEVLPPQFLAAFLMILAGLGLSQWRALRAALGRVRPRT